MSEVRKWLDSIGLAQYADAFETNDLDIDLLGQVDDQLLKDIGVSSAGHRLRIRNAIAKLGAQVQSESTDAAPVAAGAATAERRQVTVMFSDLVGSTALSARIDPEDLREVISSYQKCVAETVGRFGGFVAKYMGDGVLVYFGYPQAHEHDAERAVRAGLELVAAVGGLKTHAPLQTRVGIATGLVVVGDLIGSGASQEQAIVGETPNLAARLQGVAEPNAVVVAESTCKLVGNLFELQDLGARDLKGISGPVKAWAALRPSSSESRFDALHAGGLTALVGREEELELLLRRWSKAKAGEGQVVLLSGEPGIGKSRLTAALLERIADEPHTRLRNFCSPQHTESALSPTIGQIERAAGFRHDDAPQTKLDKLDTLLAQSSTSSHDAALLSEMLSLANDGRYPALELIPQERRQRTLEALVLQVAALERQNPLLMIFEDAHWADPTSLELFGRIVDKLPSLRTLLIVTHRQEFDPPWIGRPHVTALTLNRLGEREIGALIDGVTGNKLLPANVRQDIVERTDGIPLFVEEMTKAVLEAATEGEAGPTAARAFRPRAQAVPASLHASLMARLDRLGPAKEVAQIGAAIGREFSHALLGAVAGMSEAELASSLDRLVAAGLLFRQGVPPHATYLFKHALVQDAAYGTLLREPRRALHARIGEALENQFAEIVETQPHLMAQHCSEAGHFERAINYWLKAGQQAVSRSAMPEAEALLRKGLALLSRVADSDHRKENELDLQIALGLALSQTQGFHSDAAGEAYSRARQLCDELKRPRKLLPSLYGQWVNSFFAADLNRAEQFAVEILSLGELADDVITRVVGYRAIGGTSLFRGDFPIGCASLEQGLKLYDPSQRVQYGGLTSVDTHVALLGYLAPALACCGQLDQALSMRDKAVAEARDTSHAPTLAHMLWFAWWSGWCAHSDPSSLLQYADELVTLSTNRELGFWHTIGTVCRGWCLVMLGQGDRGISEMTAGVYKKTRATLFGPLVVTMFADAFRILGQAGVGLAHLMDAERQAEATRVRYCQCETFRLRGVLLTLIGDCVAAESSFCDAISLAQRQGAKIFELRAALDLSHLWRSQGKPQQARELLAPVYGWFTEGFDTRDLKEAKALLEELAA